MRLRLKQLLSVSLLALACGASVRSAHAAKEPKPAALKSPVTIVPSVPGVVYAKFKSCRPSVGSMSPVGVSSKIERVLRSLGVEEIQQFEPNADAVAKSVGIDRIYVLYYSSSTAPIEAVNRLLATGEVESASPRYVFKSYYTPQDPLVGSQWALTKLGMFKAWDVTKGDTNVIIADCDQGINWKHEDLRASVKINWGEMGLDKNGKDKSTNGIDDDKDGAVDNVHGWDVVGNFTNNRLTPDNDPVPDDAAASHGTLTAGCISAANNTKGVVGMAFGCRLLPVKISAPSGELVGGYEGIHFSSTHHARVINCSWGGVIDQQVVEFAQTFVDEVFAREQILVAASGNDHADIDIAPFYPAAFQGVLAVGATDEADAAASFSNYGNRVKVFAPGANIYSTFWPGDDAYAPTGGTSFSAPIVSGVVGLMVSKHPDWPTKLLIRELVESCDNVVDPSNRTKFWGRINPQTMLTRQTQPGLDITSYSIDGKDSASLNEVNVGADLRVTFKNFTADAENISIQMLSTVGYNSSKSSSTLGALPVGQPRTVQFGITRTGVYSEGKMPVFFAVTDGKSYRDTLVIYIPLVQKNGFTIGTKTRFGSSIKRVNRDIGWASFGIEATGITTVSQYSTFGGAWQDPGTVGTAAIYCVDAIDDATAWMGTGPQTGSAGVYRTDDGGGSWILTSLSSTTPFVNAIHFYDAENGVLIGDPRSSTTKWGIGATSDGGKTWKLRGATASASLEASWNNSAAFVGDNVWFGSNSSKIYHSTDRGLTFTSVAVPFRNCLGIAMHSDAMRGLAVFRSTFKSSTDTTRVGENALMRTVDGGATWQSITLPAASFTPASVAFVPDTNVALISSNLGLYRTTDLGATWSPIGVPVEFDVTNAMISIGRDESGFFASALTSTGFADYEEDMTVPPVLRVEGAAQASGLSVLSSYPNPATDRASLGVGLSVGDIVSVSLYDLLGREVRTSNRGFLAAGLHTVQLDLRGVENGVYRAVVRTSSGARQERAIVVAR